MTGQLDTYRPPAGTFDEAVGADGAWRPGWSSVVSAVASGPTDLVTAYRQAVRLLDAEGAGHLVHDAVLGDTAAASRPWRLDPIPFVLDTAEFATLQAGLVQRMRLLEAVVADLYGAGTLVGSGVLPRGKVSSAPQMRTAAHGAGHRRWLVHAAFDLVRTASGEWRVVGDHVQAPGGVGYALLDRNVMARIAPDTIRRTGVAPVHPHLDALRRALTDAAPLGVRSPRCVVLTGGPEHPRYIEHSWLASHLGYHLVEGGDVVMRGGQLWLRALDGLEPLDVVWRGLDDGSLDPLEVAVPGEWPGVPGLVWGASRGAITIANAYGSAVLELADLRAALPAVAPTLIGEQLLLPAADGTEHLATVPVFDGSALAPGSVTLRMFAVAGNDGIRVMQGGGARVLRAGDDPLHPSAELVKDVWVIGHDRSAPRLPLRASQPPQVDLATSVPRRAADALYQLGRTAERTEVLARAIRTVSDRLARDPGLADDLIGGWSHGVVALLRAARGASPTDVFMTDYGRVLVLAEMDAAVQAVVVQSGELLAEARSVREFLSTTTGRVLGRIATGRAALMAEQPVDIGDTLDTMLADLAALAGLAVESTVRGPAWRFLDLGRRLERGVALCGAVQATLGLAVDEPAFQPLTEVLLASCESLVAYRRRYRSDIEVRAVLELLVLDDANPRSLAFQVDRLREHTTSLVWPEGIFLVDDIGRALMATVTPDIVSGRRMSVDALVLAARGPLLQLSDAVHQRWFADPVHPVAVRGR